MNLKPGPKVSSDQNPGNLLYIYKKNNIYIYISKNYSVI